MVSQTKHLHVRRVGDHVVVGFRDSDILYEEALMNEVGQELKDVATEPDFRVMVLDLAHVRYLASRMWGKLVHLQLKLNQEGRRLKLWRPGPIVTDVLDAGLGRVFEVSTDVPDAIEEKVQNPSAKPAADP